MWFPNRAPEAVEVRSSRTTSAVIMELKSPRSDERSSTRSMPRAQEQEFGIHDVYRGGLHRVLHEPRRKGRRKQPRVRLATSPRKWSLQRFGRARSTWDMSNPNR